MFERKSKNRLADGFAPASPYRELTIGRVQLCVVWHESSVSYAYGRRFLLALPNSTLGLFSSGSVFVASLRGAEF
jgi:hypothetical protein